uniref:Voltage-gated T-type calcium channel n=1 Tax=Trichoplax adhaerens TaxID=10228 RepID=A0A0K0KJQ9_TRIAD|nr:voltage-gated T-type calcium channel [Trichoplax adhaerens]
MDISFAIIPFNYNMTLLSILSANWNLVLLLLVDMSSNGHRCHQRFAASSSYQSDQPSHHAIDRNKHQDLPYHGKAKSPDLLSPISAYDRYQQGRQQQDGTNQNYKADNYRQPHDIIREFQSEQQINSNDDADIEEEIHPVVCWYLHKDQWPRKYFVKLSQWRWFERITIIVILINCVTLGSYNPAGQFKNNTCVDSTCQITSVVDNIIFGYFVVEMIIKMVALGVFGKYAYFSSGWNRLDFIIVLTGCLEYLINEGEFLTIIRTVRVLRPLRAINRVPSMRLLVNLLLDTLPLLGNVLMLCFIVFSIFGIVGVQLWKGILRSRCTLQQNITAPPGIFLYRYYLPSYEDPDYVCSLPEYNGIHHCRDLTLSNLTLDLTCKITNQTLASQYGDGTCTEYLQFYDTCSTSGPNIFYDNISFDNFAMAFIAIFQVITLEAWVDIMYAIQDGHASIDWIYFVILILIGSLFLLNFTLVVMATQFSETKRRVTKKARNSPSAIRSRRGSFSTLSSSAESRTCYNETIRLIRRIILYIAYLIQQFYSRCLKKIWNRLYNRCLICKRKWSSRHQRSTSMSESRVNGNAKFTSDDQRLDRLHQNFFLPDIDGSCLSDGTERSTYLAFRLDNWRQRSYSQNTTTTSQIYQESALRDRLGKRNGDLAINNSLYDGTTDNDGDTPIHPLESNTELQLFNFQLRHQPDGVSLTTDLSNKPTNYQKLKQRIRRLRVRCCIFTKSQKFSLIVLFAILANTIVMAIEHHNQPTYQIQALEVCNIIFTIFFTLEMVFKLFALGLLRYAKDSFNVFDAIIVIVSLVEIATDGKGLSVLRSFRLLRIFKIVRFLPTLQRQMMVMAQTFDNVVIFLGLLFLFMFTFSILGMHLFGNRFCLARVKDGPVVCSRKNFDSLLWAFVTVFQILTQEDWNVVMYDGMLARGKWAAIYFLALVTLGNYVLLNLLVAILVNGFQEQEKDEKNRKKDLTAKMGRALKHYCDSITDVRSEDQPANRQVNAPDENSGYQVGRDLQGIPTTQIVEGYYGKSTPICDHQSCAMESSALNQSNKREEDGDSQTEFYIRTFQSSSLSCNHNQEEEQQQLPNLVDPNEVQIFPCRVPIGPRDPPQSKNKFAKLRRLMPWKSKQKWQAIRRKYWICPEEVNNPNWLTRHRNHSLLILPKENRFRKWCKNVVKNPYFDRIILVVIIFNCVTLAMERPGIDPNSMERHFLNLMVIIFTFIFTSEMIIKVLALGLVTGDKSYLRNGWNVLDLLLVIISWVDLIITYTGGASNILGVLRILRGFRTLRPLRVINRAPGLKLVVQTLFSSLKAIGNIVIICVAFFVIFGILGVQLFSGKFYYCKATDDVENKTQCVEQYGLSEWVNRPYNFDDLVNASLSLFVISSKDGWMDITYHGIDARGVDLQPKKNHNVVVLLYFISFLLLVGFFVLNMFVGVVVENFHKCQEEHERRQREKKRNRKLQRAKKNQNKANAKKVIIKKKVKEKKKNHIPPVEDYPAWRRKLYRFCVHRYFDITITIVIAVNIIFMATEHYKMSQAWEEVHKYANYFFTVVFTLEAVIHLVAFGVVYYFRDRWNIFDLLIVILSWTGIIIESQVLSNPTINPTIIRVMRLLRIVRILKLIKAAKGIRALLRTIMNAMPQVVNLGMLFFLLFFIFAALGIELFGRLDCTTDNPCNGLSQHANFKTFGMAMLTLFRIATGDNWQGILQDTLRENCDRSENCQQNCCSNPILSSLFFVIFVLAAQYVLTNVVVAVLMKHLEESDEKENNDLDPGSSSAKESQGLDDGMTESNNYYPPGLTDIHLSSNHKNLDKIGEDYTTHQFDQNHTLKSPLPYQNKYARITVSRSITAIVPQKSTLDQAENEVVMQDKFQVHDIRTKSSYPLDDHDDVEDQMELTASIHCENRKLHRQGQNSDDGHPYLQQHSPLFRHQSYESNCHHGSIQSDFNSFSNLSSDTSSFSENPLKSNNSKDNPTRDRIYTADDLNRILSKKRKSLKRSNSWDFSFTSEFSNHRRYPCSKKKTIYPFHYPSTKLSKDDSTIPDQPMVVIAKEKKVTLPRKMIQTLV